METLQETKTTERKLYWREPEAEAKAYAAQALKENRLRSGASACADALNDLYKAFKFKTVADVEGLGDPTAWAVKMTIQNDKALKAKAEVFELSALKIVIPDWIASQRDAMLKW